MKKKAVIALCLICLIGLMAVFSSKIGVWSWARSAGPRGIACVTPWNGGEDRLPLSEKETAEFVSLLNGLHIEDITKNAKLTGGTPTFGLRIETVAGVYYLNEAAAPAGALEIAYGGAQWWIDNAALRDFVRDKAAGS